jgi:hypothetical protein
MSVYDEQADFIAYRLMKPIFCDILNNPVAQQNFYLKLES